MQIKFAVNWERLKEKLKENKEARKAAKRIKSSHIADFSGEGQDLADHFNEQKTAWPIARWIALGLESNHDGALLQAVERGIMISKTHPGYPVIGDLDKLARFFIWFAYVKTSFADRDFLGLVIDRITAKIKN
ncbi:hypothetical protein LAV84_30390 [Rhizobium sp. VS19-DR104.2]|uniref:hypothetical protein n=1 Tax=unclassified Rhizobium TaxID=2613769 RepID=UPI001C5AD5B8|nr:MULTISPECIES: hypothetical protein [unclassified Rhizobium]MBZ5763768.1 hypothetical protein [Rhizobium sp. VS19-DR96]MBZ5769702.1 hypothetical protein [Rhizobium sp. VS19-DR129.2]MBZ5777249.1 hypothetical protein [Rhizobium sp. VS19-DRK62.2]MBZ5788367.1 hypothetical protein [Rhizobium sp. VS19-DR121]MBZ5805821.1 hypothetical protein [Rhizobium sp. VS19-DR181]